MQVFVFAVPATVFGEKKKQLPDAGDVVVTARLFVLPGRWRERIKHSSDVSHVRARESAGTECESLKAQPDIFYFNFLKIFSPRPEYRTMHGARYRYRLSPQLLLLEKNHTLTSIKTLNPNDFVFDRKKISKDRHISAPPSPSLFVYLFGHSYWDQTRPSQL